MFSRATPPDECSHPKDGICSKCSVNAGTEPSHPPELLDAQKEFFKSLIKIGRRLRDLPTKEAKSKQLMFDLYLLNYGLPARIWLPIYKAPHIILRIPFTAGCVLNSKDKAPYCIYLEVLDVDNIETVRLPEKKSDPELLTHQLGASSVSAPANLDAVCSDEMETTPFMSRAAFAASEAWSRNGIGSLAVPSVESIDENPANSFSSTRSTTESTSESENATTSRSQCSESDDTSRDNANNVREQNYNDKLFVAETEEEELIYTSFNTPSTSSDHEVASDASVVEYESPTVCSNKKGDARPPALAMTAAQSHVMDLDMSLSPNREELPDWFLTLSPKSQQRRRQQIEHSVEDPSASTMSEPWDEKLTRIKNASPYGHLPNWQLKAVIVKTGDDLNYEKLAYKFLATLREIWEEEQVKLYLRPYRIFVLSNDAGLIEPIPNACSLHQIKRNMVEKPRYDDAGQPYPPTLLSHFFVSYGSRHAQKFINAQKNFIRSCAAYCLVCYFLQVKDRHNGNILLDHDGHLIHIDFGYILSMSPRNLGFETSPFKLTQELIEVMNGPQSEMFAYFKWLMKRGLVAARKHQKRLIAVVEKMIVKETFGQNALKLLEERFLLNSSDDELQKHVDVLVEQSRDSLTTRLYDNFQYYTNGIF